MRLTLLSTLLVLGLSVACQQEPQPRVEQTPTASVQTRQSSVNFEDNEELSTARQLLVTHMKEVEGLAVPAADTWLPQSVQEDEAFRIYTFNSSDWTMRLTKPLSSGQPFLYRAEVNGPQSFAYTADILPDGVVAPAQ
jgi:hypothetical protein